MNPTAAASISRPPAVSAKPATQRRPTGRYIALAVIFVIAVAYQLRTIDYRYPDWFGSRDRAAWPFLLEPDDASPTFRINFLQPNALSTGLQQGDTLVAVNGRPVTGSGVFGDAVAESHAGDRLHVTIRSHGELLEKVVTLGPAIEGPGSGIVTLVGVVIMPVFCILLGFWVVAVRPRDARAWLLLPLLLMFATFFDPGVEFWGLIARDLGAIYHAFVNNMWGVWLLLFAVYFPERFPAGSRGDAIWKSVMWVLGVPLSLWAAAQVVLSVGVLESFSSVFLVQHLVARARVFLLPVFYLAIAAFFACLGWKWYASVSRDFRRRLRLVLFAAGLAFLPRQFLALMAEIRNSQVEVLFPFWLFDATYLLQFVFPPALAYVIVVQRTMDVRVVIRQGLQYTLARRGVLVLRLSLSAALFTCVAILVTSHTLGPVGTIVVLAAGLWGIFLLHGAAQQASVWIDRRFFRDAYNAEQILSELAENVRTMVETQPLLETVTQRITDALHIPRMAVLLDGTGPYRPAYALGYGSLPDVVFPERAATVQVLKRERQPVRVYFDDPQAWIYRLPGMEDDERGKLAELRSELLLPLLVKDELIGFMSLGQKLSEAPYSGTDLRLLNSVAAQTSMALEVSRLTTAVAQETAQRERLNRELEIAREVQEHLFPQELPEIPSLDYCGHCQPAREVGGDYYDFLELPEGKLGIAIGDVSGKGIGAALMMANLEASLRGQAPVAGDLGEMMKRINNMVFAASSANRYATFFYAEYDPRRRQLSYVNAGHNPPAVLRKSSSAWEVLRLEADGPVIGLLRNACYQQATLALEPGDLVVLFTDGVSESMNSRDEEWGDERLVECAKTCDGLNALEALNRMMAGATAFAAGVPQYDDMTLVVLRML